MKTKIRILLFLFSLFGILNIANANVDVTNISTFRYDCTPTGGILHTDYVLGGHHHYKRDYKINNPGIIEVADTNHTTISKNINASIDGCNFVANSCNITSAGTWQYMTGSDMNFKTISIDTHLSIDKSANILNIDGSSNTGATLKITYESNTYDFSGDNISIDMQNDKIVIDNNGSKHTILNFTNRTLSGENEFYYSLSSDNKTIILKRKVFKRTNSGTTKSSNNTYDEFEAYSGSDTPTSENNLLSDKNATGPGYKTGFNYWDYSQHNYTTTKVKIYPVTLNCSETEYSNTATTHVVTDLFNGTLAGIISSVFNGDNMKINGGYPDKMFSSNKMNISGIYYETVGEIGGVKDKVNQVTLTIKKDDFTKWVSTINIPEKGILDRDFGNLLFSLKNKTTTCLNGNEASCIDTTNIPADNYGMEILFKYNGNKVGDPLATGLIIVPNNDYTTIGSANFTPATTLYANGSDNYSFCQNITDSFGNTYSDMGNVYITPSEQFYLNQINNSGDGLYIYNNKFNSSKICFDIKSYSPGSKDITFQAKLPVYDLDGNIISYKQLGFTKNITFLKPYITTDFSIENASKKLEIGPSLNMGISITSKSSLTSYEINNFSSNIKLDDNTDHEFKKAPESIVPDNLKYSFTIDAATTAGINIAPSITLDKNPVISYSIGSKDIKYYVNKSTDPNNDNKLSLSGVKGISGIKVVGTSQTSGKAAATNNIVNFSDLSKSTMRATIKKNTTIITKGLSEGKLLNGVIYYNGDKTLSSIQSEIGLSNIETLVIKNGNLIIDQNISKDKFGIIVTRTDNADISKGNVYIIPGVKYIKASIYADGGLISVESSSNFTAFNTDTDNRTNTLSGQLVIKGSLFTRNTIGGAVKAGGQYILPGGQKTIDFNQAMIYDLNYLRRSNENQDSTKNGGNHDNVVIIYNPSIQTNPPKGFGSN